MKNGVVIEGNYAVLPGAKAFVTGASTGDDAKKTEGVAPRDTSSFTWSPWGDNNMFPQEVLSDLEKNSTAMRALEIRKTSHYGRGIVAYRETKVDAEGKSKKEVVTDPEVVEFFKVNRINTIWIDLINSLEIFANGWPEFITNKERTKINRVYVKDPAYCRLEKMNDKTFRIDNLLYSAQWDYHPSLENGTLRKIPMYDPSKWREKMYADGNFVYPVFYRSFNKSYYHTAVWNGVRANGWMNIAIKVPTMKLAIMKNQMMIKYHIIIPDDYFNQRYPSPDYTREERESKRAAVLSDMNDFLSNIENSGKAFVTFAFYNKVKQDYLSGWKIEPIDNKLKDDAYLPDAQSANSEILFAIGVDPCLIGAGIPGGALGAGSGSNKREAFWMLNAEMGPYRQISLDPLYFIRDFNGWDPTIQFDYRIVDTSQTQNEHPSKINQNIDPNQKQ